MAEKKIGKMIMSLFWKALLISIIAGVIAAVVSYFIPTGSTNQLMSVIISVVALVVLVAVVAYMGKKDMLKKMVVVEWIVFFAAIAVIGGIVSLLYAPASAFILAVGSTVTIFSLLLTVTYIAVAEWILISLKIKL